MLSFWKEELAGERATRVAMHARTTGASRVAVFGAITEECVVVHHRVREMIGGDAVALAAYDDDGAP